MAKHRKKALRYKDYINMRPDESISTQHLNLQMDDAIHYRALEAMQNKRLIADKAMSIIPPGGEALIPVAVLALDYDVFNPYETVEWLKRIIEWFNITFKLDEE